MKCSHARTWANFISHCDEGAIFHNVLGHIISHFSARQNISLNNASFSAPLLKKNLVPLWCAEFFIIRMEIALSDLATLPEVERKILSLVANRLLCATGEKHLYETVKAELTCGGSVFKASGKSILKNGWKDFEDAFKRSFKTTEEKEQEDKKLPELSEGQTFDGVQTKISEHYTTPPKHFTEDLYCKG